MVLEATMIVVDNSESSRNGDYLPSRWEAQQDAVNLIFTAKTNANPESAVGLMSMGGKGPEVLVTLTTNFGQVLEGMHRTKIGGHAHIATGIQIAALALKHRQNRLQRQRIIVFSCSTVHEEEKELVKLAKKMKKNGVSVDFIAFGDLENSDRKKLESFNDNVNGAAEPAGREGPPRSHLAVIPPGLSLLSDQITNTPILSGGDSGGGSGGGGGIGGGAGGIPGDSVGGGAGGDPNFDLGFDPSTDPELALALRMSLEEDKLRQERENKAAKEADKMEEIPEEEQGGGGGGGGSSGESQPLLKKEKEGKDKKGGDDDKMDTA